METPKIVSWPECQPEFPDDADSDDGDGDGDGDGVRFGAFCVLCVLRFCVCVFLRFAFLRFDSLGCKDPANLYNIEIQIR